MMSDAGISAITGVITGALGAATTITDTVVTGQNTRAQISSDTELTKDSSWTTRTIIIVGGVAVTVLVGIILLGLFVVKKK